MTDDDRREEALGEIRATYARYENPSRASLWDRENPGFRRLATERDAALLSLIEHSASGQERTRLLDVGSGAGHLAVLLRDALPDIVVSGIDLLPERVELARQNAPWATFTVGSADRLGDPDGSYDLATAITLFSSVPSPDLEEAIAAEIGRVLRPGGWMIWYDIRYRNPWNPAVHGISRERLTELFPGWVAELRSLGVAPPLARRMGRFTPLLYPTLEAIPPLRSHLVGRLQRPELRRGLSCGR